MTKKMRTAILFTVIMIIAWIGCTLDWQAPWRAWLAREFVNVRIFSEASMAIESVVLTTQTGDQFNCRQFGEIEFNSRVPRGIFRDAIQIRVVSKAGDVHEGMLPSVGFGNGSELDSVSVFVDKSGDMVTKTRLTNAQVVRPDSP